MTLDLSLPGCAEMKARRKPVTGENGERCHSPAAGAGGQVSKRASCCGPRRRTSPNAEHHRGIPRAEAWPSNTGPCPCKCAGTRARRAAIRGQYAFDTQAPDAATRGIRSRQISQEPSGAEAPSPWREMRSKNHRADRDFQPVQLILLRDVVDPLQVVEQNAPGSGPRRR